MYIHKYYLLRPGISYLIIFFWLYLITTFFFVFNLLITTYSQIILIFKVYNNSKLKSKLSNLIRSSELISFKSIGCSVLSVIVICYSLIFSVACSKFLSSCTIFSISSGTSCSGVRGGAILPFSTCRPLSS